MQGLYAVEHPSRRATLDGDALGRNGEHIALSGFHSWRHAQADIRLFLLSLLCQRQLQSRYLTQILLQQRRFLLQTAVCQNLYLVVDHKGLALL